MSSPILLERSTSACASPASFSTPSSTSLQSPASHKHEVVLHAASQSIALHSLEHGKGGGGRGGGDGGGGGGGGGVSGAGGDGDGGGGE